MSYCKCIPNKLLLKLVKTYADLEQCRFKFNERKRDILRTYSLIFDGFGIKLHSIFVLTFLKVLISFHLHFFTFLNEDFPQKQDKRFLFGEVKSKLQSVDRVVVSYLYVIVIWSSQQWPHCPVEVGTHLLNILSNWMEARGEWVSSLLKPIHLKSYYQLLQQQNKVILNPQTAKAFVYFPLQREFIEMPVTW